MKKFWLIVSGLSGAAAIVLAFLGDFEKVFITGAVGAMAWFLHYRAGLREKLALAEPPENDTEEVASDEEE